LLFKNFNTYKEASRFTPAGLSQTRNWRNETAWNGEHVLIQHERKITNQFIFSVNAIAFNCQRHIVAILNENVFCVRGRLKGTASKLSSLRSL